MWDSVLFNDKLITQYSYFDDLTIKQGFPILYIHVFNQLNISFDIYFSEFYIFVNKYAVVIIMHVNKTFMIIRLLQIIFFKFLKQSVFCTKEYVANYFLYRTIFI